MPLRDDLFKPIPGDNPSGANLRYDPVTDKIKEARREDLELPQGDWKTALKTAEYPLVIKLAGELDHQRVLGRFERGFPVALGKFQIFAPGLFDFCALR